MKVLLIRHGETVDNVAGNLAGITDSALTTHGVLQTQRLGAHLAAHHGPFASIFTSDLQRARLTAQAILDACKNPTTVTSSSDADYGAISGADSLTILPLLREQDFGSLEGKPWTSNRRSLDASTPGHESVNHVPSETKASMDARCNTFIDDYVMPLLIVGPKCSVVVVSHGLLLSRLWKSLLSRVVAKNVKLAPEVVVGPRGIEHLGMWSNTGVLELEVWLKEMNEEGPEFRKRGDEEVVKGQKGNELKRRDEREEKTIVKLTREDEAEGIDREAGIELPRRDERQAYSTQLSVAVRALNACTHLASLKRTRGGIGSSAHDSSQKTLDGFFKRQRTT